MPAGRPASLGGRGRRGRMMGPRTGVKTPGATGRPAQSTRTIRWGPGNRDPCRPKGRSSSLSRAVAPVAMIRAVPAPRARCGMRAASLRGLAPIGARKHAGWVVAAPGPQEIRGEMIRQRLGAVRARIQELRAWRADNAVRTAPGERLAAAQQHLVAARAAADRALAASAQAYHFAAEAHERAALQHERAAVAGTGDAEQHGRQAADHRAAAVADMRQSEHVLSLLRGQRAAG